MKYDEAFSKWIDNEGNKAMEKVLQGKRLSQQEIMFLVLKAQADYLHSRRHPAPSIKKTPAGPQSTV